VEKTADPFSAVASTAAAHPPAGLRGAVRRQDIRNWRGSCGWREPRFIFRPSAVSKQAQGARHKAQSRRQPSPGCIRFFFAIQPRLWQNPYLSGRRFLFASPKL
jgi:hypothetical protein